MTASKETLEKYLVQLRRIEDHREKGAEKQIRKLYKGLLKEVQSFLGEQYMALAEDDKLTFAILQQHGDYARFLEEVEQRLNSLSMQTAQTIRDTVEQTYAAMYNGMIEAVNRSTTSEELRAAFQGLQSATPEIIKRAVENPIFGLTLNDRLERNRRDVIYNIKQQIGIGLTEGDRFSTMARRISEQLDMDYNKAVRIVRTETHRVMEAGAQDSAGPIQDKLKETAAPYRLVKIWRTMGDERVRPQRRYRTKKGWKTAKSRRGPNHVKMNGATVLMDEAFDLGNGVTALRPGSSGVAGHDINCRCKCVEKLMDDEEFFQATGRHFVDSTQMSRGHQYTGDAWPKDGKPISPAQLTELTDYAKSKGISLMSFENYDGDVSLVRDMVDGIAETAGKFAALGIDKRKVILHNSFNLADDDFAETVGRNIYINNYAFRDKKLLQSVYAAKAAEGWFVPGTDYRSIAYHEMGHVIVNMGKARTRKLLQEVFPKTPTDTVSLKVIEGLSEYGAASVHEAIAESVSAFVSLKNPPSLALTILRKCGIL